MTASADDAKGPIPLWDYLDDIDVQDLAQIHPAQIIARYSERSPAELQEMLAVLDRVIAGAADDDDLSRLGMAGLKVLRTVVREAQR